MPGMVELPLHTAYLLDSKMMLHEAALALHHNKEYDKADEAFARAAETSMSRPVRAHEIIPGADDSIVEIQREVAYGRILIAWAMSTAESSQLEQNTEARRAKVKLALCRALRGHVLLSQDQHGIVTDAELDDAREKIEYLGQVDNADNTSTDVNEPLIAAEPVAI